MEKVKTFFTLHLVHIFEAMEAFNGQIWKELHIQYQHIGKWDLFVSLIWSPLKKKRKVSPLFSKNIMGFISFPWKTWLFLSEQTFCKIFYCLCLGVIELEKGSWPGPEFVMFRLAKREVKAEEGDFTFAPLLFSHPPRGLAEGLDNSGPRVFFGTHNFPQLSTCVVKWGKMPRFGILNYKRACYDHMSPQNDGYEWVSSLCQHLRLPEVWQ